MVQVAVARGSASRPATRSESSKNGGKWRFFEGKKSAILPVLIEFSKYKALLSLLLCWRTFLALTSKKNVGAPFS